MSVLHERCLFVVEYFYGSRNASHPARVHPPDRLPSNDGASPLAIWKPRLIYKRHYRRCDCLFEWSMKAFVQRETARLCGGRTRRCSDDRRGTAITLGILTDTDSTRDS